MKNSTDSMNFEMFVNSPNIKNVWIYERDISVYVRRSLRFIDSKPIKCLDIATVQVTPKHQSIGIFKEFLNRFEEAAQKLNRAVFVESVLSPRFRDFFLKRGYLIHPHSSEMSPCLYKIF